MIDDDNSELVGPKDDAAFSIEALIAFQRRMQSDPDSVSDSEIQNEYGSDISPHELRELFRKNTFGRAANNQRASARAKLRRRLLWLSRSLEEIQAAVAEVRSAPGRTNKQLELDGLLNAIEVFRSSVNLPVPVEPSEVDPDLFERMFGTIGEDKRQSTANQTNLND